MRPQGGPTAYDRWFDSEENRRLIAISTRTLIRNIGIGGILWGVINLGIGCAAIQESIFNVGILILALMMLGTGIQAMRKPDLAVFGRETLVTVLLFLWNLGVSVLNYQAGGPFDPRGLAFPLIVAIGFATHYWKLRPLRDRIAAIPSEKIEAARRLCKALMKKKLREEPALLQTADRRCRIQLLEDRAFFVQRDFMRMFVAPHEAVRKAKINADALKWTCVFRHPLGTLKYRWDKGSTDKLRAWLQAAQARGPAATTG